MIEPKFLARVRATVLLLILPALLSACALKAVQVHPPLAVPSAFSAAGDATTPDTWWTVFGDANLDAVVEQALGENFTLRAAWDRLDQATAIAVKSGAPLYPSVDGQAGYSRHVDKWAGHPRLYNTSYGLGVRVGYEVDLWGRVRSTRDAERLDVLATAEDLDAAAITLSAEIVSLWYRLAELEGQLVILDQQIETNRKHLAIVELKFSRRQVVAADLLQQQQVLESTKGDRALVESAIETATNQLAVLTGRPPGELDFVSPASLPDPSPLPRTGMPAELIRRRPDVRKAELRVQAADRRVAAAIADRFPKLSLIARTDTSVEQLHDLFDNWFASLMANMVAPLFDGGRRKAEVERTRAVVSERLNAYGQVVLTSILEVENALAAEAGQVQYVASLTKQLELSRQATQQTLDAYAKGSGDFTRYLTTLLSHQRLQRTHLRARRELVQFRINLYRALAGGFPLTRPAAQKVDGPAEPVADTIPETTGEPIEPQNTPERSS